MESGKPMKCRSWLFVPADSERKLSKAAGAGADAVILDLEDAVMPDAKQAARSLAGRWLQAHRGTASFSRWVRINALDTALWREDLRAVLPENPTGVVVPKAAGPQQLQELSAQLLELEESCGLRPNSTRILALIGETPAAALSISAYPLTPLPRLAGLTWGAEDLSLSLGVTRKRTEGSEWADPLRFVRVQVLLAARACGVAAIDTLHADFRNTESLKTVAATSRADGFDGMLAIHPDQVPIINAAFGPSEEELAQARAIVELFAANPGAGALSLAGRMIDQPHLTQAKRLLGLET